MTDRLNELRGGLIKLRDAVLDRLTHEDQQQISELIDANEYGVALEWILDALAETKRKLPQSALTLIEKLAREMDMYPAILERIPPELIPPP